MTLVPIVAATSTYALSISPSTPVNLGTMITLTLSLSGGTSNSAYTTLFDVVKPNTTGSALTSRVVSTNNLGAGSVSVPYPDPSWTPSSGTVATDVAGVYNVYVNQTSPTNIGTVASGQFTVNSKLTVVISQPLAGTTIQRGQTATIGVTVSSSTGPDTGAMVSVNTPSNGLVFLAQTGVGVYSANYVVSASDPTGPWTIVAKASDSQGNSDSSSPVTITVTKEDLIVNSLATYDSQGVPTTSFSPGDTIYAFYKTEYSSGPYLTSGQYSVSLKNASGTLVRTLNSTYNPSLAGFYTSTGYMSSMSDPAGTWTVEIGANSLNDTYGNTGPSTTISHSFRVKAVPPIWPAGSALTASNVTPSSLVLSWTAATSNDGVASYRVFENGTLIDIVSGNTTSVDVTGLKPGGSYEFNIEAVNDAGNVTSTALMRTETMPAQQATSQLWLLVVGGIAAALGSAATVFVQRRWKARKRVSG